MQFACLIIVLYLGMYYRRRKKLPTYSSKLFGRLCRCGIVNLIFDMVTVYTVNHMDYVPSWFNDFSHRLFIFTINMFMYLVCKYIIHLVEQHTRVSKNLKSILLIPLITAMVIVMGTKMEYQIGVVTNYATGLSLHTCYISVVIYLGLAIYCLLKYRNEIDKRNRDLVLTSMIILSLVGLVQKIFPELLISSLGVVLCIISIFIIAENPGEFIDKQLGLFNEYGLVSVLHDLIAKSVPFGVIVIPIKNLEDIREKYNSKMLEKLVGQIAKLVHIMFHEEVYLFSNRTFVIITKDRHIEENKVWLAERFARPWQVDGIDVELSVDIQLVENASLKRDEEQVLESILDIQKEACNKEAYRDTLMDIRNRNAFEKDILILGANKERYFSIFYIAADVNGLKQVNDHYGHQAGDELLKSCAEIVRSVEEDNIRGYRLGGDEFGLLVVNKTEDEVKQLICQMEKYRKKINCVKKHPVSFAVGYARYLNDADECLERMIGRADKMMYENKAEMKKKLDNTTLE